MKITFYGATEAVTGSLYYIETEERNFIVDCGLYQGIGDDLKLNKELPDIPFDQVDFILLTHAHIDHCGRIPLLIKNGVHQKIYCTEATYHLSEILLKDSANIIAAENELENKRRQKAGLELIDPFITEEDVYTALTYFYPITYDKKIREGNLEIQFFDTGHLLGSACIQVTNLWTQKSIVFSGDLGSGYNPLLNRPISPPKGTYILTESTYGNRQHENVHTRIQSLTETIESELANGQLIIIPSFAVGRTQELLYALIEHYKKIDAMDKFLSIPIYVDSPLAKAATKLFKEDAHYLAPKIKEMITKKQDPFITKNIIFVDDMKDSIRLSKDKYPKVIISSSGMCQGGRIINHLKENIGSDKTSIIFVGYQGEGTLGRQLLEQEQSVIINETSYTPNCRIIKLSGFSGHGDREMIKSWLKAINDKKHIFITHGEEDARQALKDYIHDLGVEVTIPKRNETIKIED